MASVKWNPEGLDSLIQHDAWRVRNGWVPLTEELIEAIEVYFDDKDPEQPPRFLPGWPVELAREGITLRMITVPVRSKAFRVYFRYDPEQQTFEIVQVVHRRAR